MTEREFQISFERKLTTMLPEYNTSRKLNSDTIFYYINAGKDEYVKLLFRVFQLNQEITDKLRTLVKKGIINKDKFTKDGNIYITTYPEDYLFALGEEVHISIMKNNCPKIVNKTRDVIEATIENVDRILENSLSEYHLHHNQARPVRLYTDNSIILITDGQYDIDKYVLTYLRPAYDLGNNLGKNYTELPEVAHKEIVDAAVNIYISELATTQSSKKSEEQQSVH